ncbi:MAG: alkaline phosphatase D family protein [Polyangiaceae bacterium]
MAFSDADANTTVVDLADLEPATAWAYRLQEDKDGATRTLVTGMFRTARTEPGLKLGVTSCHRARMDLRSERWNVLARHTHELDAMLMVGDQIYDSDPSRTPGDDLDLRYRSLYWHSWSPPTMRDVLQTVPTYMILDDHEIMDDWGGAIVPGWATAEQRKQFNAALRAYGLFQHAHNPRTADGKYWYEMQWPKVASFVLDLRTRRAIEVDHHALGGEQWRDFQQWASSPAVADADVLLVTSSVPFAFTRVDDLAKVAEWTSRGMSVFLGTAGGAAASAILATAAAAIGAVVVPGAGVALGAAVGTIISVGAFIGGWLGFGAADRVADYVADEADIADHWIIGRNRKELQALLDTLFGLACGERPKAVVILSGDIHIGGLFKIYSSNPRHARNPVIHQLVSSPVTNTPVGRSTRDGLEDEDKDGFENVLIYIQERNHEFDLVGSYRAERVGDIVQQRNFGRVDLTPDGPRKWTVSLAVEANRAGTLVASRMAVKYDLDGPRVQQAEVFDHSADAALETHPWSPVHNWRVESEGGCDSLTASGKELWCTRDNRLLRRSAADPKARWVDVQHANNVVSLAVAGGQMFALDAGGTLWARPESTQDVGWGTLGSQPELVALAGFEGQLLAATRGGAILSRSPADPAAAWSSWGELPGAVTMGAAGGWVVAIDGAGRLLARETNGTWVDIGAAPGIRALAGVGGALFGAGLDGFMRWMTVNGESLGA